MPTRFFRRPSVVGAFFLMATAAPATAGGALSGGATEFTQVLNNSELVTLAGQGSEQIANQVKQISNQVEQIQNQIRIYQNMLQNTLKLPDQVWGQAEQDLASLRGVVQQGRGIAFSMGNLDDVLKQRFQSYANFQKKPLTGEDFSKAYQSWSDANRDTIAGSLKAAGLTADQFSTEEETMGQLRAQSETAQGQMQALQVGHEIAAQEVAQMQKLRGLVAQQMTMMGAWYQTQQTEKDLAQSRRDKFFSSTQPSTSGGQQMKPRW